MNMVGAGDIVDGRDPISCSGGMECTSGKWKVISSIPFRSVESVSIEDSSI